MIKCKADLHIETLSDINKDAKTNWLLSTDNSSYKKSSEST